jgi:hypothetical protein
MAWRLQAETPETASAIAKGGDMTTVFEKFCAILKEITTENMKNFIESSGREYHWNLQDVRDWIMNKFYDGGLFTSWYDAMTQYEHNHTGI